MEAVNLIFEANLFPSQKEELLKYFDVLEDYIKRILKSDLEWHQDLKKVIQKSFTYLLKKL